jgi:CRP-like cAMP-binding protein
MGNDNEADAFLADRVAPGCPVMKKVLYLFTPLSEHDIDWMASNGSVVSVPAGSELTTEGAASAWVFVLLEGTVSVRTRAQGQVAELTWGEVIGEMSLVDGRPASATVVAVGPLKLLRFPRERLEAHLARDFGFAARFFQAISMTLSERLRATMQQSAGEVGELSQRLLDGLSLSGSRFTRLLNATLRGSGA